MTTLPPDDQLRPGQTWLGDRGDEWEISNDSPYPNAWFKTTNISFHQRTGGDCYCWRKSTPPPGWSRLN